MNKTLAFHLGDLGSIPGLFCSLCNANPVLRVDSSTSDQPFWVGRIPLYHSSLGICIIAWGSHSSMNQVFADSQNCKQLNRTRDGGIRKIEQLVLHMTGTAKEAQHQPHPDCPLVTQSLMASTLLPCLFGPWILKSSNGSSRFSRIQPQAQEVVLYLSSRSNPSPGSMVALISGTQTDISQGIGALF